MEKSEEEAMFEEAQNSLNDLYAEEFEEEMVMPDNDMPDDVYGSSDGDAGNHGDAEEKEENDEKREDEKKKQEDDEKKKEDEKQTENQREEEKKQKKKKEEEKKSSHGITKSPKKMLAVLGGMVVGVFSLLRQAIRALLFGPAYAVRTENELGRKVDAIKDMEAKEHANKEAEKNARDRNVPEKKKDSQESEKSKPENPEPNKPVMEELKDTEQGMPTLEEQADIRIDIPFEDEPEQNDTGNDEQENLAEKDENTEEGQEEESKDTEEENEEEKPLSKNEEKEKNNGFVDKMTKRDIQKLFKTPESEKALKTFKDSLGVDIKLSDDAKTLALSKDGKTSRAISATAFLKGDVRELSVACKDIGLAKKDFQYRNCDTKYIVMAASMCAKFRKDNLEAGNFVRSDGAVKNVRNKETLAYCSFAGDRGVYKIDISKSGKSYTTSIGNQKSGEEQTGEMVFNDKHFKDFTKDAIKRERHVSHESILDSFSKKHQFPYHEKETGKDTEKKETDSPKQEHVEKLSKDEKDMALNMVKKCRKASDSLLWTDGAGHEAAAMKESLGRSHEDAMKDLEDMAKKIDNLAQKGYSDGLTHEEDKEFHRLIDRAAAQVTAAEYAVQHARGANETVLQPGDIAVLEDIVNKCGPEDAALYAKASALLENPTQYMSMSNKQQLSDIYKEAEEKGFIGSNRDEKKETENHINHDKDNKEDLEEEDVIDVECKDLDEEETESDSPKNDKDGQEETDNDTEEKDEQVQNVEEEDISL